LLVSDGASAIVLGAPLVVSDAHVDVVVVAEENLVVGRVTAVFDLSQVPPEFHGRVVGALQHSYSLVYVRSLAAEDYPIIERREHVPRRPATPAPVKPKSWIESFIARWFG